MKHILIGTLALLFVMVLASCSSIAKNSFDESTAQTDSGQETEDTEMSTQSEKTNALGGMNPSDALEYMKTTPDLVIVQVNTAEWKIEPGFTGALWIPHDEMAERYDEIPEGKPVILHCGGGIVSVPAYETLLEKRPDIPELSYIAGSPHSIIDKYNKWLESKED